MFAMRSICSTKTPVRLLFIALCAAVSSTFAMASESTKYFSIKMQDKLIGYAVVRGESTRDAESTRWKSESVTSLKVALLGKERNTKLQFETVVAPETRQPISYRMTDTTNDVIRHVESDFDGTTAKTWTYRDGDPKGEPKTLELPEGTLILGSNNFAHWQWLLDAAKQRAVEERVELPVYLPDAGQMDQFELTLEGPQQTEIAGETRDCLAWKFEKAKLSVLVDAETNEFLRLDLAAQQTVIESTGSDVVKLAQKSAAEEILARHFAQSNVVFDDFMSVRALTVDLDATVIGSGVAGDPTGLSTVMQSFDGKKEVDKIRGKFIVKSVDYDASKSLSFPTSETDATMDQWLKPSTYIESDHGPIVDKATALTREAKTRWDAVTAIGDWVHQEIAYTIADTPSARLAFEKREGDCGPHSTLMVAMLQSQGIPARLVGGLVYTPSFGGSFGQHAWVEVNMGESGWIAVDPTTGEFDRMSATHIKLFEGMGGVIPTSIKVLQYDPPNRESTESDFAEARPLAWELGKSYTFQYEQAGKELGTESFTIQEVD
ncbi:MAG: transglutaminase-like domain-containing protein, partial [Planctomycetota bacterium]